MTIHKMAATERALLGMLRLHLDSAPFVVFHHDRGETEEMEFCPSQDASRRKRHRDRGGLEVSGINPVAGIFRSSIAQLARQRGQTKLKEREKRRVEKKRHTNR